jgi:hypothetical protein
MKKSLFSMSIYFFLFSVFVLSCASTPPPPGGQVTIPEDFFGIVHALTSRDPREDKLLDEMGCKWILRTFNWHYIEKIKDVFDFSFYDIYVDHVKEQEQEKKIIGLLGYENNISYPGNKEFYISRKMMPYFLRYVEETVRHYKGKVDVWCVWNEPNITFWNGTAAEFYELTKLTAERIRKTDPDAYIIGGVFWRSPAKFIKNMHKAGGFKYLDAVAFHPYAANPSDFMNVYDKFTKVLSEIDYSAPVWITEVGYPTGGWYPTKVYQKKYPIFIAKTLTGAAVRGARTLLWYEMADSKNSGTINISSEKQFGLVNKDFSRKDGSWAYELCARYLPGSRYVPELPQRENIPSGIVSFCFLDGISGGNTLILWNDKRHIQKITLNLPASALVHDISTGINTPLPEDSSIGVGYKPLIITWRGTDVPRISKKR